MTLQQPTNMRRKFDLKNPRILCYKCGNPLEFDKDHVAQNGRKITLEPNTNGEPHVKHCMYADLKYNRHTGELFIGFLSKVPRKKRVTGAVGKATN